MAWPENENKEWIFGGRSIVGSLSSFWKIQPTHVVADFLEATAAWLRNETDRTQCKMNSKFG
jgi:hypothetical protein